MALIANVNRNPKKRSAPFTPDDFSPYRARPAAGGVVRMEQKQAFAIMKAVFVKG